MARNITNEPCTLVYTLLDKSAIEFDDFYLLVRSFHTYMVETIIPHPESSNVHVKLNYQASLANAEQKLGGLASCASVSKLSTYIADSEISHLEQLRRKFNIGTGEPAPGPSKKRSYKPKKIMPYARNQYKAPALKSVYDGQEQAAEHDSEASD